ncbi:hypothetical protein [Serratia rubidaea]|uniref:hypothetical protein n=1 Tax=Serratia rubidaea TaxID=61652 RepID=UPI000A8CCFB7|nr:hypothetical protein [Serratia rubidaea]
MNIIDIATKIIIPAIGIVVAAIGQKDKWIITTDRLFEKYAKLSKFTFKLSNQLNDSKLKDISGEYGYAAIIRKKGLTKDERYTLLNMLNPVEGIEDYHTCSDYLKISVIDRRFVWKNKHYNNIIYKRVILTITSICYYISSIMLFIPIFYQPFRDTFIGVIFRDLTTNMQIGISLYIMIFGLFFFVMTLNKLSKIYRAEKLIKSSTPTH